MAIFRKRDKGRARSDQDYHDLAIKQTRDSMAFMGDTPAEGYMNYCNIMEQFGATPRGYAKVVKELK